MKIATSNSFEARNSVQVSASRLRVCLLGETIIDEWVDVTVENISQKSRCVAGLETARVRQVGGAGVIALHLAGFVKQVDCFTNGLADADVGGDRHAPSSFLFDLTSGFEKLGLRPRRQRHPRSFLGKAQRDGSTDSPPGARHEPHSHPNCDEFLFVVRGQGTIYTDDGEEAAGEDDVIFTPAGYVHGFNNTSSAEVLLLWGWRGAGSLDRAGYELHSHA